jgi:glycosyltransferase involved in cell wall biosynthesis
MSAGCAIVASDTQPLKEAIEHNQTGLLFNFFDPAELAAGVVKLLENPAERQRLGANARKFAQSNYDLHKVCLPKQVEWVSSLARK